MQFFCKVREGFRQQRGLCLLGHWTVPYGYFLDIWSPKEDGPVDMGHAGRIEWCKVAMSQRQKGQDVKASLDDLRLCNREERNVSY